MIIHIQFILWDHRFIFYRNLLTNKPMITKVCPNNFLNSFCPNLGIACQYFLLRLDAIHSLKLRTDEEFQAVTKDLTSSSKFSGSLSRPIVFIFNVGDD